MYAPQSAIDPSLAALLQTAAMVTPDQTPTVAAQVAQAAQQKMQPQGIMQGMQGAKQDYAAAAPSVMQNMKQAEVQRMMQQAMQPQPAGIEGLPAQNMQGMQRMAGGGVVGFAGYDEFGSFVPDPSSIAMDKLRIEEEKRKRQEDYQRQQLANEAYRQNIARQNQQAQQRAQLEFLESAGAPQAEGMRRQQTETPQASYSNESRIGLASKPAPTSAPVVSQPSPVRTSALQTTTAPATGVASLPLPAGSTLDRSKIDTAGKQFMAEAEKDISSLQGVEQRRKEAMKLMPDLNQRGIGALEAAEQERKRLLDIERSDDPRRRWAGVFRGWGGDRDAYDRIVGGIANRDQLANQAQLGFEQARIKEMQAQQARALGEFDRERGLIKESAELKNKARDDMLKSQQIESGIAQQVLQSQTTERGQNIQAREGELNRANAIEIERMRRATANQPGETERIIATFERLKAQDPAKAEDYLKNIERVRGLGKGIAERQDVAELKALITSLRDQADPMKNFDKPSREQASAMLKQAQDKLAQMSGLGASTGAKTMTMADIQATAASSRKTPEEVRKAAIAAGYTIQ